MGDIKVGLKKYDELPLVSGSLVFINIIIFLLCLLSGGKLYAWGRVGVFDTFVNREYGRILWAIFLHSDLEHIFHNMLVLFFLGGMIEKEIGHLPCLFLYLLSGVGGNLLSLFHKLLTNDWSYSIGASGAVFGLDGVLLALVFFAGKRSSTVTPVRVMLMIGLSLYNGFSGKNIDNAAHVGGLLTGFLATIIILLIKKGVIKNEER